MRLHAVQMATKFLKENYIFTKLKYDEVNAFI